jgi:threonine dehydratase
MTVSHPAVFDLDAARALAEAADLSMFGGPRPFLRRTPLWKLPGGALGVDCREIWLKLEHLQVSGSFKARGMLWRLMAAAQASTSPAGAVIASGGNAGIACAQAAAHLGMPCEVFVPEVCPQAKRDRLAALGAKVMVQGARYPQALEACLTRQRESGAVLVHAYDQPEVVIGAGTLALEIEAQGGRVPDATLVSVGGGGLVAGLAAGFGQRGRVVALEPELAPTLARARAAGEPLDVEVGGVAVDSLGARRIGSIAWAVTQRLVEQALTLSDEAIRQAQQEMWRDLRLAVEPAAALPLAALRSGAWRPAPEATVCLVVCGANVDPGTLSSG